LNVTPLSHTEFN